jgi:2-polyprenyl-3-methyl-5-hydroxy-6-metoxy-1,4-benzoquinol methylase
MAIGDDGINWDDNWTHIQVIVEDAPVSEFAWCRNLIPEKFTVCELGCGPGRYANAWKQLGGVYYGIDMSPVAIRRAKEMHPDIADHFIQANNSEIHLFGTAFDIVFTNAHLQHIDNTKKAYLFRRVTEHIRLGGLILMKCEKHDVDTKTTINKDRLVDMIKGFGFELIAYAGDPTNGFVFRRVK